MNFKHIFKKATTQQWAVDNPVLEDGEPGWDRVGKVLKIGDGRTPWNDLDVAASTGAPTQSDVSGQIDRLSSDLLAALALKADTSAVVFSDASIAANMNVGFTIRNPLVLLEPTQTVAQWQTLNGQNVPTGAIILRKG